MQVDPSGYEKKAELNKSVIIYKHLYFLRFFAQQVFLWNFRHEGKISCPRKQCSSVDKCVYLQYWKASNI